MAQRRKSGNNKVNTWPFLSALQQSSNEALLILDVGCGRGEWLRLLGEHGYSPQGVDISQTMVDFCRLEGLQAEQGEVLTYLAGLADESLHVISAFHLIEHLSFEQMVSLFDACLRILKPGGKLFLKPLTRKTWWSAPILFI